jgi:hypothetical protein
LGSHGNAKLRLLSRSDRKRNSNWVIVVFMAGISNTACFGGHDCSIGSAGIRVIAADHHFVSCSYAAGLRGHASMSSGAPDFRPADSPLSEPDEHFLASFMNCVHQFN